MPLESETKQKTRLPPKAALITGCILIVGIVAVFIITQVSNTPVNCEQQIQKANSLIEKQSYKQAYSQVQPYIAQCTKVQSSLASTTKNSTESTKTKIQTVQYDAVLAQAASQTSNNGKQALQYTKTALQIYNAMSPSQQVQVPNYQQLTGELVSIDIQESSSGKSGAQ